VIKSAKIMLLGDIGVGKTSLANRLVFDRFDNDYKTTIGVNVLTHDVALPGDCGGGTMRLVLWDTDGDFGHVLFSTTYVLGAAGAIVVSDATRPDSVAHMDRLASGFEDRMPGRPVCRVVNKIDLLTGEAPAAKAGARLVSARTSEGVGALFVEMGAAIHRRSL